METSRPFSCNQCSRAFNRQEHLIRHLRIHSGEKPFQCSVCMKKFSRSDELVRHARLHARAADSAAYAAAVAAAVTNLPSTPALSPTASAATSIVGDQDSSSAVTSPEIEQAFLPSSSQRRFSFDTQHPLPSSLQTMTEMEHSSQSSSTQRRFSLDARPPLPPSSEKAYGSFATSYPRRMSLCSYRDDVEPEAVSSTLSTSAPVTAPLLPRLSSSYSFTSHSTQLNQNIASHNYNLGPIQPSQSLPALQEALSFESGSFPGSTSISDSRRMSTQSNSYIPVHDMSENDTSAHQQQQQHIPSNELSDHSQSAQSFYSQYHHSSNPIHTYHSVVSEPFIPTSLSLLDRTRNTNDALPQIPEHPNTSEPSPVEPSYWPSYTRPRGNSNVSLQSNASNISSISALSDDTGDALYPQSGDEEKMETAGRAKKVYQCTVDTCGKVFSRSSHRSRHYKSTHIQPFAFKCPVLACGKRFSRSDILKKHVKVHTTGSSNTSDIFTAALVNEARAAAAENGPGIVTTDTALAARLELGHHHPSGHQQPSYISTTINSQPSIGMPMEIGEQQGYRSQGWTPSSSLQYQYPTPVPTPLTSPSLAHVNVNFNVSLSSSSYTSYPTTTSTVPTSFAPTSTVSTAWATPHYAQYSPPATLPQLSTFPHQSNSLSNSITLPAYRSSGQIVNHDRSVVLVQPSSTTSTLQYHTHRLPPNFNSAQTFPLLPPLPVDRALYSPPPDNGRRKEEFHYHINDAPDRSSGSLLTDQIRREEGFGEMQKHQQKHQARPSDGS